MFKWLKKYNRIFVTGPQRSGTRICAEIISYDTGHFYIDESDFFVDSLYMLFSILHIKKKYVIHCPGLCRYIHMFDAKDNAIILMRRSLKDIIASQKRIKWSWEWLELTRYDRSEGKIAEIKYKFWEENQKKRIKNYFEIDYESLKDHPLWVPSSERSEFKSAQTLNKNLLQPISSNIYPYKNAAIIYSEDSEHKSALLIKTHSTVKKLNISGKTIWKLCDGKHTRNDILKKLKEYYPEIEENILSRDLDSFLLKLHSSGFLRLNLLGEKGAKNNEKKHT